MKLLIVYNICGIRDHENIGYYINSLESIRQQIGIENHRICVSACKSKDEHIKLIKQHFDIPISHTKEVLPVNVTFNKTCIELSKNEEFDGYLFMDSGCQFIYTNTIEDITSRGEWGMITCPTDTDTAFRSHFGWDYPPHDFIIPVGQAVNCHCQVFNSKILQTFGRIIPDIFASFSTESVFPFLNASVGLRWLIMSTNLVKHLHGMDGASSGFGGNYNLLPQAIRSLDEICADPEGTACGFGYEECRPVKLHDPAAYNEDGSAKYPERLTKFMMENCFLPQSALDYDKIDWELC